MEIETINAVFAGIVLVVNSVGIIIIAVMNHKINKIPPLVSTKIDETMKEIKTVKKELLKVASIVDPERKRE